MFGWRGHERDGGLPAHRKLLELFSVGDFKTNPKQDTLCTSSELRVLADQ